jgi:gamma-glutamyltranspeptidase/glutathione hydrolase
VVLQLVLNTTVFNMNIADATAQPRLHHQWLPDELYLEPGFGADTVGALDSLGHVTKQGGMLLGNSQSIMYRDGYMLGASDTRRPGGGVATVEEIRWPRAAGY